jgi:hypothetical protein
MPVRQLFGGAMECSIPDVFVDLSDFREIPNHQEVFSDGYTDSSVIIEVMQVEEGVKIADLAAHHFRSLAQENWSTEGGIDSSRVCPAADAPVLTPPVPCTVEKCTCVSRQLAPKFRETAKNLVRIQLFIIRLGDPYSTEIVISLNSPMTIDPTSTSSDCAAVGGNQNLCESVMNEILATFKINDYGLFTPMQE